MGGSKSVTTGYNYSGTFAQAIGLGPATRLTRITNGQTEIWSGDLDQSSRDGDGMTLLTTTIGTIRFYWGRTDQNPDALLSLSQIDFGAGEVSLYVPAWPHVIYFVADNVAFGGSPTPPTLTFEYEVQKSLLTLSAHHVERDAVIPEVIYDVLTNALWGGGISTSRLNTSSFVTAAETTIAEGITASPYLDENSNVREFIGLLLSYIDGYLRYENGEITLGLMRKEDASSATVIDESLLADEPRPVNEGWRNTWNMTRVVFTDRDNDWESDAVETFEDVANQALTGERVDEEVRLPFVTRRAVAKILAKRKGLKGGLPQMTWELEVLPSLRTLRPGDLAKLTYSKRGITNRLVRILEVNRSVRDNRTVRLTVEEEITRDEEHDYVPPEDDFSNGPQMFALEDTTPRLSTLTTELKNGHPDGFAVFCHRPHKLMQGFECWFTWNPLNRAYGLQNIATAFPAKGVVRWWTGCRNNTGWLLRINFQTEEDKDFVLALLDDGVDFYAAVGRRLYKSAGSSLDQHQVDVIWLQAVNDGYVNAISATELEMEFTGGAFGSTSPAYETLGSNGNQPTLHIYIGRVVVGGADDFLMLAGNVNFERAGPNSKPIFRINGIVQPDTDWKRHIRTPTFHLLDKQALLDSGKNIFDRNDTTMCPNGTYDTDWGERIEPLAELYDAVGFALVFGGAHPEEDYIEALDTALYREAFGFASTDEFVLLEDTDAILGFITATGASWYNKQ